MSFDCHSDALNHPAFLGKHGHAAMGIWVRCGSWTATNGETGVVPLDVAAEVAAGDTDAIDKLVENGIWRETPEGYEMLRGPSSDFPMPLWRYDEKPETRRFIDLDHGSAG